MPNRPNVLVLHTHDLGRHLHCYGVATVQTPHLDRLAAGGVLFENAFCVAPQCSPSRAAMFTGRYPHTNGVMGLCHGPYGWDLNPGEVHLAAHLSGAGYHSALVGQFHESHDPNRLGFDEVIKPGNMPCEELAEHATAFLERRSRTDGPWYLQAGFFEPHRHFDFGGATPDDERGVTVPNYLVDEPAARAELAAYQGIIRKMDAAAGRVLDTLRATGQEANTLVVFTTDHGIPFPRAKLRGYDPGLAICLMMRWPAAGWQPRRDRTMLSNVGLTPTLLDLAGVTPLAGAPAMQGRTFAGLLTGAAYGPRETIFAEQTYHGAYDPFRIARTTRWKLIANFADGPMVRDPSQAWHAATQPAEGTDKPRPALELYDLANDPGERRNLAGDAAHESVRREMLGRLGAWMRATADPLLTGIPVCPMHRQAMAALGLDHAR